MDSYELLMKGGKDGPVIVAGSSANSVLFQRITLPPDHKQFMPAEGEAAASIRRDRMDQGVDRPGRVAIAYKTYRRYDSRGAS